MRDAEIYFDPQLKKFNLKSSFHKMYIILTTMISKIIKVLVGKYMEGYHMALIERAARALAISECGLDAWRDLDPELREELKGNARAVISAIRVPTLGMCMAGHELSKKKGIASDFESIYDIWIVMIDEALLNPCSWQINVDQET